MPPFIKEAASHNYCMRLDVNFGICLLILQTSITLSIVGLGLKPAFIAASISLARYAMLSSMFSGWRPNSFGHGYICNFPNFPQGNGNMIVVIRPVISYMTFAYLFPARGLKKLQLFIYTAPCRNARRANFTYVFAVSYCNPISSAMSLVGSPNSRRANTVAHTCAVRSARSPPCRFLWP